ncbi:hypothetical protein GGF43_004736, partial [Coemansia sp. RSA 2618]
DVVLPLLGAELRRVLCFVCALLRVVARSPATRMTAYSLAVVWAPNMARSKDPVDDVSMCAAGPKAATVGAVVQLMVDQYERVFAREIDGVLGRAHAEAADDVAAEILGAVDLMNQASI